MPNYGFAKWTLLANTLFLLLLVMPCIAGCNSTTPYERPRNMDTPRIYADSPVPMGRLKD